MGEPPRGDAAGKTEYGRRDLIKKQLWGNLGQGHLGGEGAEKIEKEKRRYETDHKAHTGQRIT